MIRRLFSHTVLYGFAPQLTKMLSILVLPLLTKYLTPIDYAVAGLVSTYSGMFSALQYLGLTIVIANSFYRYNFNQHYKIIWRQLLGFLQLYAVVFGLFVSVIFYFVIPDEARINTFAIIITNVLPTILFDPTQLFVSRYYQKNERPLPLAIRAVVVSLLGIGFNILFIAHFKLGYMGWFYAGALSALVDFLIFFYPFYFRYRITPILNFKWRTIKKYLRISIPTIPHYYSSYLLRSSDRAVMDIINVPTKNIGLYSFAYNFGNYFEAIGTAFANASGPMYLKNFRFNDQETSDKYARNLTYIMQIFFMSLTVTFSLWTKEIFELLVKNQELKSVYPLSIVVIMAYNYKPMYFYVFAKINFYEKTKKIWRLSFMGGLINVVLNFTLIPFLGFEIAAYTTFISMMYIGYSGFFMKSFKEISSINFYPIYWLALTIFLTIAVYFAVELPIAVKVVFTALLGVLILYLLKRRQQLAKL